MMLKQSPSRNQRSKSLKVKQALQICVILAICIWLIYQVKQSHSKKAAAIDDRHLQASVNGETEYQILKMGRKDLKKPRLDELTSEFDEEVELEDERVPENEEIDEGDKEKSEEDLINEDDKE